MSLLSTSQITIVDLEDGRTQYTHLAWCNLGENGKKETVYPSFTKDPEAGRNLTHIGIYQDFNAAGSDNPKDYNWSQWLGYDGKDGVPGRPGADGRTPYIHFAYADSPDGRTGFTTGEILSDGGDIDSPVTVTKVDVSKKLYMGTYTDYNVTDSQDPTKYTWQKVRGADGVNGVPGKPGADGRTPYIHFAYANSADGRTGFSVSDAANKEYIGTYTDFVEADSTDPTKYKWTKVKGSDGQPGAKGADGKSSYAHFAYANSSDGRTDFSTTESYNRRFVGTYTDSNEVDSTDPTKYKWVDMVGNIKVGGRNLWVDSRATGYAAIEKLPENHITGQTECYRIESGGNKNNITFTIAPDFTKRFYTTLTLSAWVKYENVKKGPNPWQGFNCFKSIPLYRRNSKTNAVSSADYPGMFTFDGSSDWRRIERTYNYGWDDRYDEVKMGLSFLLEGTASGTAWITGIKVETGTVATDYTLSSEDYEVSLSKKADQTLTQEQINKLSERNELLRAEMEAKASQDVVDTWIQSIKNLTATEEAGRKEAEAAVIRASERINELQQKIGELKITTEFVNTYMSQSEEGLIVGQKDGSSKVLVSSDRISFVSGGKEVASISQGVLQIDNGVFVKSLRIGRFVTIQDPTNADRNLTMYVGGV